MKTIFDDGKTKVLLDEGTGVVSLTHDGISCLYEENGVTVRVDGYREQEIHVKKKPEHRGEFDGGLDLFYHLGSWNWRPGEIVPK